MALLTGLLECNEEAEYLAKGVNLGMQHDICEMDSEKFEERRSRSFAYFKDCFLLCSVDDFRSLVVLFGCFQRINLK